MPGGAETPLSVLSTVAETRSAEEEQALRGTKRRVAKSRGRTAAEAAAAVEGAAALDVDDLSCNEDEDDDVFDDSYVPAKKRARPAGQSSKKGKTLLLNLDEITEVLSAAGVAVEQSSATKEVLLAVQRVVNMAGREITRDICLSKKQRLIDSKRLSVAATDVANAVMDLANSGKAPFPETVPFYEYVSKCPSKLGFTDHMSKEVRQAILHQRESCAPKKRNRPQSARKTSAKNSGSDDAAYVPGSLPSTTSSVLASSGVSAKRPGLRARNHQRKVESAAFFKTSCHNAFLEPKLQTNAWFEKGAGLFLDKASTRPWNRR